MRTWTDEEVRVYKTHCERQLRSTIVDRDREICKRDITIDKRDRTILKLREVLKKIEEPPDDVHDAYCQVIAKKVLSDKD